MLLDLCTTLLLENLQSVFGSEECVTIAKKNSTFKKKCENTMNKQWTKHINTCQKHTKNIVVGSSFGFFFGILAASKYQCSNMLHLKRSFASKLS